MACKVFRNWKYLRNRKNAQFIIIFKQFPTTRRKLLISWYFMRYSWLNVVQSSARLNKQFELWRSFQEDAFFFGGEGGFLKLSICLHSSKRNRCGNEKEKFEISISQKHFSLFLVTQTQTIYSPEFSPSQKLYCNCFYLYYVSFVFEVNRVRFQYQAFGSNSFCLILSLSKRNSAFYVVDLGFSYYFVGALRHKTILHQTVTETMKYSFWSMLSSLNSRHVSYSFFSLFSLHIWIALPMLW